MNKKQMLEQSLERITLIQKHIESIIDAARYLSDRSNSREPIKYGDLHQKLIDLELEEWRGLFMWGLVCDDKTRDRVKAAAYNRFLNDKTHVAHWFNNGQDTSQWLCSDEEEFRAMAKEAFEPKK